MAEYSPSKIIKDGNTYNFRDNTKIPLSGTNALAGSIVPSTDNSYDFGSSSYKLRYVYCGTAYVTNLNINGTAAGDILTHNANEFVDVTSAQTIGGKKIFSDAQMGVGKDVYHFAQVSYGVNTPPASTSYQYIFFSGNTASQGFTNSWYSGYIEQIVNTDGSARGRWQIRRTDETIASVEILAGADNTLTFRPTYDNQMQLGDSTHAWKDCKTKAINGINPGALSLPGASYINLDTTDFDTTSTTIGTFTPTVDGWAILSIQQKNKHFGIWILHGSYRVTFHSVKHDDDYMLFALVPVRANVTMTIYCTANDIDSTRNVEWLRFFPCPGNV